MMGDLVLILAFIALAIAFGLGYLAGKESEELPDCPKLIYGYDYCNEWHGQPCDHSEAELERARWWAFKRKMEGR